MSVTPYELAISLGLGDTIDNARAQMLIDDAVAQAEAIVTDVSGNLPAGSDGIIRAAVGRQYLNTGGATTETVGPYSVTRPAPSGSIFSSAEIATLERLAGRGGAFSVDTMPTDAGTQIPPWDLNIWEFGERDDLLGSLVDDDELPGEWS